MSYASNTKVSAEKSRAEIERLVMRHGADEFGYLTRRDEATIRFVYKNIPVEMTVPMPDRDEDRFRFTPCRSVERTDEAAFEEWQKEVRRCWRSLCLVIKAMLVGVDDGVITFEQAFMPYIVCLDGRTISQHVLPHLQNAIETGSKLKMLPLMEGQK